MRTPGTRQPLHCKALCLRLLPVLAVGLTALLLVACSGSNKNNHVAQSTQQPETAVDLTTSTPIPPARTVTPPSITIPGLVPATPRALGTGAARPGVSSTPGASLAAALSPAQLAQRALQAGDLPSGFVLTNSGPGGPELGPDVTASFQEEFQQRDVTSAQSLQQTIVIVDLLGIYRDAASAATGVKGVTVQTLNQALGSGSGLTAQTQPVTAIGDDTAGYHFTGASNGVPVGGYLIVFHRGPLAAMIVTAAPLGAESLPQTISLAQKQDDKLQAPG